MASVTNQGNQGAQGGQGAAGGGTVMDKAKETASNVADKAKQAATAVKDRADSAVSGTGKGMENLAGTIRERGPQEGMLGQASTAVADTLERTGDYLEQQGLSGMADDLTNVIRRNPIPAVLIGVGVGFLLARLTTPRSNY